MDYAGIDHLPVVFFFKNGVLKARVLGFEAIMKETFSFKKKNQQQTCYVANFCLACATGET
jgi:hypothetical protein